MLPEWPCPAASQDNAVNDAVSFGATTRVIAMARRGRPDGNLIERLVMMAISGQFRDAVRSRSRRMASTRRRRRRTEPPRQCAATGGDHVAWLAPDEALARGAGPLAARQCLIAVRGPRSDVALARELLAD